MFVMKDLNLPGKTVAVLLLLTGGASLAQLPGSGGANNLGTDFATLSKLFGEHTAFTAKSDVRVYDRAQKEKTSVAMNFACLDKKCRVEIDISQMKSKDMPAGAVAAVKQMGMDRLVTIVRPEQKARYLIFPGLESYVNTPLTPEEAEAFAKNPKFEKSAVGKETLDGHACVKHKVTATDDKGVKTDFTVWMATDLKDFPVQILTKEKDDTVIIRYKDIRLARPDAKQFDVPAGFKEYRDYLELTQAATMKMMNEAAAPPPNK
jgi:hypothetical protein